MIDMTAEIFLTFDCEDFINERSISALNQILMLLHKYNLKGLFFITGHMAEKITYFPEILELLEDEEIGYHSSGHSVRPTILEYTDLADYEMAFRISMERETKHINPLTGELEEKGGITLLNKLFPSKKVVSFRAPGFSFSPPHLEALRELGIEFDFSTSLSRTPISYRDLTFYPYPCLFDTIGFSSSAFVLRALIMCKCAVLDFHPSYFVNSEYWDSQYFSGNPGRLSPVQPRTLADIETYLRRFEYLLKILSLLEKKSILEITPSPAKGNIKKSFSLENIVRSYQNSISWISEYLGYKPKFIFGHFRKFFLCDAFET